MERLTALMFNSPMVNDPAGGEPLLGFDPGCTVVLVGRLMNIPIEPFAEITLSMMVVPEQVEHSSRTP